MTTTEYAVPDTYTIAEWELFIKRIEKKHGKYATLTVYGKNAIVVSEDDKGL